MKRFVDDGPTQSELERVQSEFRATFVRGIERIGGFGGKSDILASSEVFGGTPDAYKDTLRRSRDATPTEIRAASQRWLRGGESIIEVRPFAEAQTGASDVDRSRLPTPGAWPDPRFPELQRATLSNGLSVVLAERHDVPLVRIDLHVDAGYASDSLGLPGTAMLALDMLDEGTQTRGALEISDELSRLGATLDASSNLDDSTVELSALTENLVPSLELFADVVLHPAFRSDEFERARAQQLSAIAREQSTPSKMALRVFPPLLYGSDHAYGIPFTGSGTIQAVKSLTPEQLRSFHERWFRPNNATLVVVGDTTLDEILPLLERLFAGWQPAEVPEKPVGVVDQQSTPRIFLIDRPDSQQTIVLAGHLAPPKANPDEISIEAMNQVLGGSFSARMNMNLREDKHWSYGARTYFVDARGQRPFLTYAPVQTDKTGESMAEILRELVDIREPRPPEALELARVVDQQTLTLPGRWETIDAIADSIGEILRFGFADDYWQSYPGAVRALELGDVRTAARREIVPGALTWVIVGDRAKIEAEIDALGIAPIQLLDVDGTSVADEGARPE